LAVWAAAASTAGETAAGAVRPGFAAFGGRGGKSGLAPATRSNGEEAGHVMTGEALHPFIDGFGAARPQEAAAGHGRSRDPRGDLEEGGGALPLVRLGAGIAAALQFLALLRSKRNGIHKRLSLAN